MHSFLTENYVLKILLSQVFLYLFVHFCFHFAFLIATLNAIEQTDPIFFGCLLAERCCCCCCCLVAQLCPVLCNPVDCSPPGSSVHRILQGKILQRVAISFSRGSSQPRDWTHISFTGRQILYHWATREALKYCARKSESSYTSKEVN